MGKGVGFLFLFWIICICDAYAQKQNNIWYFGYSAGLNFNSLPPGPLIDGQVSTLQGSASIADKNGRLLFYSDGATIWDRRHKIMKNGDSMSGSQSATQPAIIVPFPGDTNIYYLFTHGVPFYSDGDEPDHDGDDVDPTTIFAYSIIDMRNNNGFGSVILKNDSLLKDIHGGVGLARCKDGSGYWVVVHLHNSGYFYAYKLDNSGVHPPVISNIGGYTSDYVGYIRISPDGSKLAIAYDVNSNCQLFEFDNDSGKVKFLLDKMPLTFAYGIEFSPDSRLLYMAGEYNNLVQYNISSKISTTIYTTTKHDSLGALQLGPDMKIYSANASNSYINVIDYPNREGIACNFRPGVVYIGGGFCQYGLPTFLQYPYIPFHYEDTCFGSLTKFKLYDSANITSIKWDFGDTASHGSNVSTQYTVNHTFTRPGKFKVTLKILSFSIPQTFSKIITIDSPIILNIHNIKTQCDNDSVVLKAYCNSCSYIWQDASTKATYPVHQAGKYWVTVTKNECTATDTVVILHNNKPVFSLGHDSTLCQGQFLLFSININNSSFLWQDGKKNATYLVSKPGLYSVTVSNDCGTVKDSVKISYSKLPIINFGQDTFLCTAPDFWLDATNDSATYLWQDGSTASQYHVTSDGQYSAVVINKCGTATKTMNVYHGTVPIIEVKHDITVCDSIKIIAIPYGNDSGKYVYNYLWNNGITSNFLKVYLSGIYTLTTSNYCGSITDTTNITINNCDCRLYIPNSFTPNGDSMNEVFKPTFCVPRSYMLRIYNRWGEKLFESQDINIGWNGRFKGVDVPDGEYLFIITLQDNYGKFKNKTGTVLVLRK